MDQSPSSDAPNVDVEATAVERRSAPIMRTALALFSVQGLTWASSLVGVLFVPRFLGANGLGAYAAITTAVALISLVASLGTANHVVREVARNPARAADLVAHTVVARLGVWAAFFVLSLLVAAATTQDAYMTLVVAVMVAGAGVGLMVAPMQSALQGAQRLGKAAIVGSVVAIGGQAAVIAVLAFGGGILALAVVGTGTTAVTLAFTVPLFWGHLRGPVKWSRVSLTAVFSGGLPFLMWEAALHVYGGIDYLVLGTLTDAGTVGRYAFAYRLAGIPVFAATVVTAAIYPTLASSAGHDAAWFKQALTRGIQTVIVLTVPMAVGLAVLSPELVGTIGGGADFSDAAPLLAILAFHIPFAAVHTVLGTSLFARDRQRVMALVAWAAAVLNPLLNVLAIPLTGALWGNGAIGAAVVTGVTELFMGAFIWKFAGSTVHHRAIGTCLARTVFSCAVMAILVRIALSVGGLYLAIVSGALVYAALAVPMRLVSISDLGSVRSAFGPRFREVHGDV